MKIYAMLLGAMLFFVSVNAHAQSRKNKKEEAQPNSYSNQPQGYGATYGSSGQVSGKINEKKLKKFNKSMGNKQKEFYDRLEANAKARDKMERKMKKPQYSDPSYFGHKRKPKKHKAGKKKFCKECQLWH